MHYPQLLWLVCLANLIRLLSATLLLLELRGSVAMSSFAPGPLELIGYLPGAGTPCHERLLLAKDFWTMWVICTPDLDVYIKDINGPTLDLTWSAVGTNGHLPRAVAGMGLYGFGDMIDLDPPVGGPLVQEGIDEAMLVRAAARPSASRYQRGWSECCSP